MMKFFYDLSRCFFGARLLATIVLLLRRAPTLVVGRTLVRSFRYAAFSVKRNISLLTSFQNKRTIPVFIFHPAFIHK